MSDELFAAIAVECKALFPGVAVYRDNVPQRFDMPGIMVTATPVGAMRTLFGALRRTQQLDIAYYPGEMSEAALKACRQASETMLRGFLVIGTAPTFLLRDRHCEIVDGVAHLVCTVNYVERAADEAAYMEQMDTRTKMEG